MPRCPFRTPLFIPAHGADPHAMSIPVLASATGFDPTACVANQDANTELLECSMADLCQKEAEQWKAQAENGNHQIIQL